MTVLRDRSSVRFEQVLRAAPDAYLLLTPTLEIVGASDAYLRATSTSREAILGRALFDVFPDNPEDPRADGVANLRRSLERVLATKQPHAMAVQKYDIRRPVSEGEGFEERHWSPLNTPVLDEHGEVELIVHRVEDITSRVKLERSFHDSDRALKDLSLREEARFRALLETAPDAIVVVGTDTRITFVNVQAERLFGYDRRELLGLPLETLVPDGARGAHTSHVARYFAAPDRRPMGSGVELTARRRDGTEIPIEVSLSPIPLEDGLVVSAAIRDTSERKRVERERRVASERLASAVESIQEALAIFDADDRLLQCNSGFRGLVALRLEGAIVGRTHAEVVGAWSRDLQFDDEAARSRWLGGRSERLARDRSTIDVRTIDGRSLRIVERPTPEGGLVVVVSDTTDDATRLDALRAAQRAAEEADAAKTEFLSSMSHELRTPLNAILGFAQLLQRDKKTPLDPRQETRVTHILRGGRHLLRLIDDILDLSRIEARKVSVCIEPIELGAILRDVVTHLEPFATSQGIALEAPPMPRALPLVLADATRLTQILMNLASNAVKYNRPEGRVALEIARPAAQRVRVSVRDTGLGIPLEKQRLVFQPFQRAGQEAGPIEGTGIGLAISRRLAELMGGSMGFESEPGVGSTFWVEMPLGLEAPADAAEPSEIAAAAKSPPARGLRHVLYVEDNAANVAFMEELCATLDDIALSSVQSAEEALARVRSGAPDVILMDINLPGMNGLEALRVLRSSEATASVPVIALTAAASPHDRERGERAGFFRYLAKPIKLDELESALVSALGRAG